MIPVPASFHGRPYAERHFRAIVAWARDNHPFYARWLTGLDHVPVIDRRTFLAHNDEILNGHPVTATTSGSTGIPVRLSQDAGRQRLSALAEQRFVSWLGGRLSRVQLIHPRSGDRAADLMDINRPLAEQIDFVLMRHRTAGAVAIVTYPSNAEQLAQRVLDSGLDMGFIRRFGVYAECFEPHQEALVQRAFPNARIWSTYSSMEFGLIAGRCPFEPAFHHVNAEALGVEILDDADRPCAEGERGRVVITDYFNHRTPFIRYELGDYAVRGRCPCGRITLPALARIDGKVRGTLLHRDGRRVVFTDLSVALRDLPGMRQYQVLQHGVDDFTVRLVAQPGLEPEVATAFAEHFGYVPDRLRVEYTDAIPREANGKFYASISEC